VTAHKLYPVRVRLVNFEGEIEWFTVAYVPVVKTLQQANAQERARVRRANVLQRVLYLVFRTAIAASHKGVEVPLGGGQTALAFLRVLLYICDQPEERAILCFKSGGSAHTCSCCTVATKDMVSSAGLSAEDRDVLQTLEKQLEAADRSTTETIGVGGWCLRVMKASTAPCLLWRLSRVYRPHHCSFT